MFAQSAMPMTSVCRSRSLPYHPGGCLQALNRPLDQADAVVYLHAEVAERLVEGMPVDLDGSYGQRVESNISSS